MAGGAGGGGRSPRSEEISNEHERSYGREASFYAERDVLTSSLEERDLSGVGAADVSLGESMESAIAQRQALQDGSRMESKSPSQPPFAL